MEKSHISVCICTYKRPLLLGKLLSKLEEQITEGLFDYLIVIVDNDRQESARQTFESYAPKSKININYYVEPEQNIALARNKAIEHARGDLFAFIDDDEIPAEDWLIHLYKALKRYSADGILGPVVPFFENKPPRWVLKGEFFDRPSHPTGHALEWWNTRTGNTLLRKVVFRQDHEWFDPSYGSGGEDRDFFRRKIEEGYVFMWCREALVFESVPSYRWKRSFLIKRALLRGKIALNSTGSRPAGLIKSVIAIGIYTWCLPVLFVLGHHIFMKYLIKECDHLGKLLAFFGINLIKEKYVGV